MNMKRKILEGSFWQLLATVIQTVASLIVTGILARILTPEHFGIVSMTNTVIVFVNLFSEIGIGQYIIKKDSFQDSELRSLVIFNLFLGTVFGMLLFFLAPLAALWYQEEQLTGIIRILAINVILGKVGTISRALLQKEMQFKKITIIEIVSYVVGYGGTGIFLAFAGAGVWALVFSKLSQTIFQAFLYSIGNKTEIRKNIGAIWRIRQNIEKSIGIIRDAVSFGFGLMLSQFVNNLANQADYFLVGRYMGTEILALYDRGFHIMTMPVSYIGNIFDKVVYSGMAKSQADQAALEKMFFHTLKRMLLLACLIQIFIVVTAQSIVEILLGNQWEQVVELLRILSFSIIFKTITGLLDSLVRIKGEVYKSAKYKLLYLFQIIIFTVLGILTNSIRNVCIGVCIANFSNCILMFRLISRHIKIQIEAIATAIFKYYMISALPAFLVSVLTACLLPFPLLRLVAGSALFGGILLVESYAFPKRVSEELCMIRDDFYYIFKSMIFKRWEKDGR